MAGMADDPVLKLRVGHIGIWLVDGAVLFRSGLQVDCDGSPAAYHPPTLAHPKSGRPPGLDALQNAGEPERRRTPLGEVDYCGVGERVGELVKPANWYGIVTDDGKRTGTPVLQRDGDPYPGFYVSTTSLVDPTRAQTDPRRYVDAMTVPYVALPARARKSTGVNDRVPTFSDALGVPLHVGDLGVAGCGREICEIIYADVGPAGEIGEGSVALHTGLKLFHGVGSGHDTEDVCTLLFPGSRHSPAWPVAHDALHTDARMLFASWGGIERMRALYPSLR